MAQRLAWWGIPSATAVLATVLCFGSAGVTSLPSSPPPATASPLPPNVAPTPSLAARAVLQDASGNRSGVQDLAELAAGAFVLEFPVSCRGHRCEVVIWRASEGKRDDTPFRRCRPTIRSDGTLPIAGLPAGCYDLEATFEGELSLRLGCRAATAPGRAVLVAQPAAR
jgi:hypothetical protein